MVTKMTRTLALGLALLTAPLLAQSKVDQAVTKALGQIEKSRASKDAAQQGKLMDDALKAAEKLEKEGTPEALLGAAVIQAHAGKLEASAQTAAKAFPAAEQAPPELKARLLAHMAGLDVLRGTSKDAVERAAQAVQAKPTAETLAVLALAQAHMRDSKSAVESAEKAVAADPNSAVAHDALGAALTVAGKYPEADAALAKAQQLDPKLYRAKIHRAQLHLAAGRPDQAIAEAKAATEMSPEHGIGFAILGQALFAKNPQDLEALNQVVQGSFLMGDHSALVKYTEGKIFEGQGRIAEAGSRYAKAVEIDPDFLPARVALLQIKIRTGDWAAALTESCKLAEENPSNGEAQLTCGELLFRKDDYAGALESLERAAELLPGNPVAHAMLGAAYQANKQWGDSAKAFHRALALTPDNVDYRTRYALVLGLDKQTAAAIKEAQAVIQSGKAKGAEPYLVLGTIYNMADPKKPLEASVAFKKAVELDVKNAQAWLNLGRAQLFANAFGDAVASLDKAAQLEPKLGCEAAATTAWVYVAMAQETKSKDLSKAKHFTEKTAACVPAGNTQPAKLRAAIAKAEKGEQAEAPKVEEEPKGPDLNRLVQDSQSGNAGTRRAAFRQMASFGAEAVPYLLPYLGTDPDVGVRTAIAKALGAIGAPASKACPQLATEMSSSADRAVGLQDTGKKLTAAQEMARINLERDLQSAGREARTKIGCK